MFSRRKESGKSRLNALEHSLATLLLKGRPLFDLSNVVGPFGLNLLYEPSTPLFDLIFVHGLRGGSRKTWSKTKNPYHFWPKEWLPRDPEFKCARIHSFGYNSDWGNAKESILNVHEFGKSLLIEIANSPDIRSDGNTPIVFICHSMGGLVAKQAYILANQKPSMKPLADRIKGIIFLATPHRGSDSASLLRNILRAAIPYGPKPFLSDLTKNSRTLKPINFQFGLCSKDLKLISFYETEKTKIGFSSRLIVNKDSAILGYTNEKREPLKATHRSICKFDFPSDPNFVTVKNALAEMARDMA